MSMLYYADKFSNPIVLLQSDNIKKLPEGQRTFAMLAEAFNIDVYEARLRMFPNFVNKKRDWIKQISAHLLGLKKRQLEDYLAEFLKPEIPLDEVGILMFAWMMHKHVAVYFNDLYWTTQKDNNCEKCDAHLIYRGKSCYENTIPLTKDEWEKRKDYLTQFNDNFEERNGQDVHSTSAIVGEVQKSEVSDEDENALIEDISDTFNVDVTKNKPAKKLVAKPTRCSKRIQEKDALTRSILSSVQSTSKPRTTRNSMCTSSDVTASNIVSSARKRQGKFNINRFALKKRKPSDRKPIKCSVCSQVVANYSDLTKHIKEHHPEFRYKCRYCPKTFASSSWKYQHQNRHRGLRFKCSIKDCGKLFQFSYQLEDHKRKHTRKALYVCSTRDCLRGFTTKRARTYHEKKHDLEGKKEFVCDFAKNGKPCGKDFERKELLEQHFRGHVGKKLVTHCGKTYNWPNSRKYHQDRCDTCKAEKKKNVFKYRFD